MSKRLFLLAALAVAITSCQDAPMADKAVASDPTAVNSNAAGSNHNVDLGASTIVWTGTKPVGKHHGTFVLKDGNILADASSITGGKFTIDIASLKAEDQDSLGNAKLGGHLLSEDFFDATNHPVGLFEITNVTAGTPAPVAGEEIVMKDATHTVTGNLTLKGQSKSITFPAKIAMNDKEITTDANFNIDRTQWGMSYGNDKSLQDKFIRPEVNLQLHIVARQ